MTRNEFNANLSIADTVATQAAERARFAAVLAPGKPRAMSTRRPVGMLARLAALFA